MSTLNQKMLYTVHLIFWLSLGNGVCSLNFDFSSNTKPPSNSTCIQPSQCSIPNYCKKGICDYDTVTCKTTCSCLAGYSGVRCEQKIPCSDTCDTSFCQNEGNCSINHDTCEQRCNCPVGFSGKTCSEVSLEESPNDNKCPFDPCKVMKFCVNGGECQLDEKSCKPKCNCPHNYTGLNCETYIDTILNLESTTSSDPPLLAPISERQCNTGFTCVHGVCNQEQKKQGRFQCICDEGYLGTFCTKPCRLDCGTYGDCYLNGTTEACACHHDWIGERCSEKKPDPKPADWIWWVVGICSALIILVILILIILPMWLWKRREIFIMKIVHYIQPYEDSDGKLFDAFISYKSHPDDEGFVLNHIFQKLEKELGFKLCLHFRDFKVGETIANNILWAVENSRRTVLVISPNYLGSEFARFEFQTAHLETLRLHSRIVPIIYKDISQHQDEIDSTLKHILKTITYLEWPTFDDEKRELKFWKRLALSLPKRKELDHKSIESNLSSPKTTETDSEKSKNGISLLNFKSLSEKSSETLWTEVSLDGQEHKNYHKNILNSSDITLNIPDCDNSYKKSECLPV